MIRLSFINVKDFRIWLHYEVWRILPFLPIHLPQDLEGVTCLSLERIPVYSDSIKFPKSLKKVEFRRDSIRDIPSFLVCLPQHISQVKVNIQDLFEFRKLDKIFFVRFYYWVEINGSTFFQKELFKVSLNWCMT